MLTFGFSILPCACAAKGSIDAKIAHAMHASLRNSVMGSSNCTTVDPGEFSFEHSLDESRLDNVIPAKALPALTALIRAAMLTRAMFHCQRTGARSTSRGAGCRSVAFPALTT